MRRSARALAMFWALSLVLVACGAPLLARPVETDVPVAAEEWPGTTLSDLERGRSLYITRCTRCHGLYAPARYSESGWRDSVGRMAPRAELTPQQRTDVLRYLLTMRARTQTARTESH